MGETIMIRALQPLPRLDEITFLRKGSREFVAGGGPYPAAISPWFGRFFLIMAGGIAITGVGLIFATLDPLLVLGRPLSREEDWIRLLGFALLANSIFDVGVSILFRKMAERVKRLVDEGGLVAGELISARIRASKNGNYLQVECCFFQPDGKPVKATKPIKPFDRTLKSPPAPGSKILILYAGPKLWRAL